MKRFSELEKEDPMVIETPIKYESSASSKKSKRKKRKIKLRQSYKDIIKGLIKSHQGFKILEKGSRKVRYADIEKMQQMKRKKVYKKLVPNQGAKMRVRIDGILFDLKQKHAKRIGKYY